MTLLVVAQVVRVCLFIPTSIDHESYIRTICCFRGFRTAGGTHAHTHTPPTKVLCHMGNISLRNVDAHNYDSNTINEILLLLAGFAGLYHGGSICRHVAGGARRTGPVRPAGLAPPPGILCISGIYFILFDICCIEICTRCYQLYNFFLNPINSY